MGGSKRKSMAQMEKTQAQQDNKGGGDAAQAGKKTKAAGKPADKRPRGLNVPEANDPKILAEVKKMGAVTPYAVASQFNLRLSIAKDLLEELERRNVVSLVGGNARVRIYQSDGSATAPAAA